MPASLYHLQVNVSEPKRSFPFYKDFLGYLGWAVKSEGEDYLGIGNDTTDLWLIATEAAYRDKLFHRKNTGLNHLAFRLESREAVDQFHREFLQAHGIPTLYNTPKEFPEYGQGYYAVFFEDPDRIKLEVAYVPKP